MIYETCLWSWRSRSGGIDRQELAEITYVCFYHSCILSIWCVVGSLENCIGIIVAVYLLIDWESSLPDSGLYMFRMSNPHPALHMRKLRSVVKPRHIYLQSRVTSCLWASCRHMWRSVQMCVLPVLVNYLSLTVFTTQVKMLLNFGFQSNKLLQEIIYIFPI